MAQLEVSALVVRHMPNLGVYIGRGGIGGRDQARPGFSVMLMCLFMQGATSVDCRVMKNGNRVRVQRLKSTL